MKRHYTIPFFIPHEGCPFTCVFCSQKRISGRGRAMPPSKVGRTISGYLKTIPQKNTVREVAFFGGSFTGLAAQRQEAYLKAVQPFIKSGRITGIRVSTRPDLIDRDILAMLKKYHVTCVELGVESSSGEVLKAAKRGHTAADTKKASALILKNGFALGHQIMVGLPRSTPQRELNSCRASIAMKAQEARIYPVVVINGTGLAGMWRNGSYRPLAEEAAIKRCAALVNIFRKSGVKVLRCGLHPSEGLLSGKDILCGPFHESFGQKVETYIFGERIKKFLRKIKTPGSIKHILYNPLDEASAIGYKRQNAEYVEAVVKRQKIFVASKAVPRGNISIEYLSGGSERI